MAFVLLSALLADTCGFWGSHKRAWLCCEMATFVCTQCVPELCTQSSEVHGTLVGWALLTS